MEYAIKPRLYINDQKFWIFSDEIHQLDNSEIQDLIDSCSLLFDGAQIEMNWSWNISSLIMKKEKSVLSYNNSIVCEIPTLEIYKMLKDYLEVIIEFGNNRVTGYNTR
jgi:hypothetical protein